MESNEKIIALLTEIRDNQKSQLRAVAEQRVLYVRVVVIVIALSLLFSSPYLFNFAQWVIHR